MTIPPPFIVSYSITTRCNLNKLVKLREADLNYDQKEP